MPKRLGSALAAVASLHALGCDLVLTVHESNGTAGDGGPADAGVGDGESARLLFRSGFEGNVSVGDPFNCASGNCQQAITGQDDPTYAWPVTLWNGSGTGAMQLLAGSGVNVDAQTIGDYMVNDVEFVTGRDGGMTHALHESLKQVSNVGTLDMYTIAPDIEAGTTAANQGDLYFRYWITFRQDLATQLGASGYRQVFQLYPENDDRVELLAVTDASNKLSWLIASHPASNAALDWNESMPVSSIPSDWFLLEIFWHSSIRSDGRFWVAVNGAQVLDHHGANVQGNAPINAIQLFIDSTPSVPSDQWIDDVEIWDGFPSSAAPH